jgi:aspartyl protease family protein
MDEQKYPQRVGRGMIAIAFVGALLVMTLVFDQLQDRQRNPNMHPVGEVRGQVREVILESNRRNSYIATAAVNGRDVEVLIDTGATQVAVSERLAKRLGLRRGPSFEVATANGITTAYATLLDSVRLGNIELHGVKASVVPRMSEPDVLLGMNFLSKLEMTQSNGRLILRQYPD